MMKVKLLIEGYDGRNEHYTDKAVVEADTIELAKQYYNEYILKTWGPGWLNYDIHYAKKTGNDAIVDFDKNGFV